MHTTILLGALIAFDAIVPILVLFLLSKHTKVKRSYDLFMRGRGAGSMEDMIFDLEESLWQLQVEDQINKEAIRVLNKNRRASYQKVDTVRYNAFKDMEGKISFALVPLDYANSGFILDTVRSREGCHLYIKTVGHGQTEMLSGAEEKDALERALGYMEAWLKRIERSSCQFLCRKTPELWYYHTQFYCEYRTAGSKNPAVLFVKKR